MKTFNLLIFYLFIASFCINAQESEKQYYLYNVISFSDKFDDTNITVYYDDGLTIEKIKDKNKKTIKFKTPAAIINYISSLGWELYSNGTTSSYVYTHGSIKPTSYWIIRKPCTKEEFKTYMKKSMGNKL